MKQSRFFALLISLTVLAVFSFAGEARAALTCRSLFGDSRYGQLREDFVLKTTYKVEIPEQSEIKNQCNLGTCHLYAWVSQLERDLKTFANVPVKISHHYLSVNHWIRESLKMLDESSGEANIFVNLGANVLASRFSIFQSGIIPDHAWTGARDFHTGALSGRIGEYVQNVIAKAKWEIGLQTDKKKQQQIRESAQKKIVEIFENVVGKMPETFEHEGKTYTPQTFMRAFFPFLVQPQTLVMASADRKAKTVLIDENQFYKAMSTSIDVLEKTTRDVLDQGFNVYLSYDHNSDFVDVKTGIMSIGAFNLPSGGGPLTRKQRSFFNVVPGGHAVQIVGYDVDPKTNQVTRWKIKNSWGDKMGDSGYFHMYRDFFRAFAMSINYYSAIGVSPEIDNVPAQPKQMELEF